MALVDQDKINKRIIKEIQKIKLSGISPDFSTLKALIDSNTGGVKLITDTTVYPDIVAVNAAWDSSNVAKTPIAGQQVKVGDSTGLQVYIYLAIDPTKPTVLTWEAIGSGGIMFDDALLTDTATIIGGWA